MGVRISRRSTLATNQNTATSPPTPANAAAVWWADDIPQADGSSVATWTDRVNGIAVTQSTSGSRPVLDADGLNGKASVNFDGVDDWLGVNSAISTSNTGCVVAVFRTLGSTNAETVWCASSTSASQQYLIARAGHTTVDQIGIQSHHGTSQDCVWQIDESSFGTPNNRVVEWGSNGSSWSMRLENNTKTLIKRSGDSSPDTGYWMNDIASHNAFTIGAERFISGPLYTLGQYNMRLAYLGVFDSPLSTQDRYDLYKWIETYYGITGMPGLTDYEYAVLQDSPSAFWPMQEASGNLTDITGNGFIASKVGSGGVTYGTNGPIAGIKSIEFNGSPGVGYSIVDNNVWSSTNFTVEAWIYLATNFFNGQYARYFLTKHSSGVANEWFNMVDDIPGRRLVAQVCNTADTNWANKTEGPVWGAENTWYHVAWKLHSSTVTLYVNGVQLGTAGSPSGSRASNASGVLSIGHGPAVASRSWNGRMSMVAFYQVALSDTQIQAHYNAMS